MRSVIASGNTLSNFLKGTVTGGTITIEYQVYVPYKDSTGSVVLSPSLGTAREITAQASASYVYNSTSYTSTDTVNIFAKSIAIQKSVSSTSNPVIPGSTLE